MKKLLIAALLLLIASASQAQDVYTVATTGIDSSGQYCSNAIRCNVGNTGAAFHQLTWNVNGTLSSCMVRVDSSTDAITWNSGDVIAAQTCTASTGVVTSTAHIVNFIRVNILTLTKAVPTASLNINLTGFISDPGLVSLTIAGSCPVGWSEITAFNGKMLRGTIAANGNVGTTGGSATITPTGTINTQSFTGTSNQVTSATSGGTPAGIISGLTFTGTPLATHVHELPWQINSVTQVRQIAAAVFGTGTSRMATGQGPAGAANTSTAPVALVQAVSAGIPAGTINTPLFTGSALATHTHTLTPAGTVQQATFTGTPVDPTPTYINVIFCLQH